MGITGSSELPDKVKLENELFAMSGGSVDEENEERQQDPTRILIRKR
jgi:hypothetical protein